MYPPVVPFYGTGRKKTKKIGSSGDGPIENITFSK